ncbi:hypothetical protein [Asticcacaulis endophyticus]|uniref:Uncharacterized protein n=1 Tax=Asticcacaulis endophyticus TaxID=1395890 RepID=A0A918UUK6_9CAUL|nr:hypothetical protein [Asticcacaulis endophyticus]GGZ33897.1 hypothetical protein GCM10011273_20330 [Asticcacaulis endophyticus]
MRQPTQISWITAAAILIVAHPSDRHNLFFEVESLGHTDIHIRQLENELKILLTFPNKTPEALRAMSLGVLVRGLAEQWIFALYERLRTQREILSPTKKPLTFGGKLTPLNPFYDKLELLRMPIAKNQIRKSTVTDHPIPLFDHDSGSAGWRITDPSSGAPIDLVRRDLSDEFLTIINTCR